MTARARAWQRASRSSSASTATGRSLDPREPERLLLNAMRAKAGDPPRTMPQKILAGRADDPRLDDGIVRVRVDQVILAREPNDILRDAAEWGLEKAAVETAVAYDTRCVTTGAAEEVDCRTPQQVTRSVA